MKVSKSDAPGVPRTGLPASGLSSLTDDQVRGLRALRNEFEALLSANCQLQAEALDQRARIESLECTNATALLETYAFRWKIYALCRELFGPPSPCVTPPREIPPDLMAGFTMNGTIPIEYSYLDCTYPNNWPIIYTDYEIDVYWDRIAKKKYFIYGMTDVWMWQAIEKYPIRGLYVVNMGSLTPWYESNCLYHGAQSTTIDYNKILARTSRLKAMTVAEWDAQKPTFDVAWSISSFEHDGLGMYGDPLDPEGDLKAMRKMKRIVKPGGLMFFSVPVGRDKVLFNNARVYGRKRLPLMFEGWELLDTFGLEPVHYDGPGHIQPVFILRNR